MNTQAIAVKSLVAFAAVAAVVDTTPIPLWDTARPSPMAAQVLRRSGVAFYVNNPCAGILGNGQGWLRRDIRTMRPY
jgi:hypothetical protein